MIENHPLADLKSKFLEKLEKEKRLLRSTLCVYEQELNILLTELPEPEFEKTLIQYLSQKAPRTASRKMVIWRSFLKTCPHPWNEVLDKTPYPKVRKKEPVFLTEQEAFLLESASYHLPHTTRNRLLLACGLHLGLRLSEILYLRFQDVEGAWLKIRRKGDKEQRLPLTPSLQSLFHFWRTESFSKREDYVFASPSGSPLSSRTIQKLIDRLRIKAGIKKKVTPHSLRHTFATHLAANGANLTALKEILGHERLSTTEQYLHVTPEHLRETIGLLKKNKAQRLETFAPFSFSEIIK